MASSGFGTVFTDHMTRQTWTASGGWGELRVVPYGPLHLDPAAAVLHYAQEVFEGLKAYKHADGTVWTFRPEANAERFNSSARRLALPELPVPAFLDAISALVQTDKKHVPGDDDSSLYLRPFMFASEPFLGVRPSNEVEFMVIASPSGAYFAGGVRPVSIWVEKEFHRAGPGGTGFAKCGGNYAASLAPQVAAAERGFDQVLYLDAETSTNLEELGGMNLVVVRADGTLLTPAINGSILEGVTRRSLLQLATDRDLFVVEGQIALADLIAGLDDGTVTEVFACGTAAVVTPIGRLAGPDFDVTVGNGEPGELTLSLRQELTDIQYGRVADRHGWLHKLA